APSSRWHPGRDTRSLRRSGRASASSGSFLPAAPPAATRRSSTAARASAGETKPRESAACSRPTDTRPARPVRLPGWPGGSAAPAALPFALPSCGGDRARPRHCDLHRSAAQHQPPRLHSMSVTAARGRALGARRSQRLLHFLFQHLLDQLPHPLPQPLLQTLPPGVGLLLAQVHRSASLPHGVSSSCRDLQRRDPGFVFNGFSGEYAFHFSTGIGTEPCGFFLPATASAPDVDSSSSPRRSFRYDNSSLKKMPSAASRRIPQCFFRGYSAPLPSFGIVASRK